MFIEKNTCKCSNIYKILFCMMLLTIFQRNRNTTDCQLQDDMLKFLVNSCYNMYHKNKLLELESVYNFNYLEC